MLQRLLNAINASRTDVLALVPQLTLLTAALIYCIFVYTKRRLDYEANYIFGKQHGCQPIKAKYPCKWPLGLDVLYAQYNANAEQRLLAFQQPFIDALGPNLEIKILGTSGYSTFDPENVEAILTSRFEDYDLGSRRGGLFPFIGEGIFTQDGHAWRHSRDLLRRPFLKTHYQDLEGFTEPLKHLIESLLSSTTTLVDLQPLFFRFTLATTTTLIFGQPIEGAENDKQNSFAQSFDYASLISTLRMRLGDFHWMYNPSRYRNACQDVKNYAGIFVRQALLKSTKGENGGATNRYAFIEDLYADYQDPVLVRDQLVNILLAGRDTTACLLSWAIYLLIRHPEALKRLHEEIRSVMGSETKVTRTHIQKMVYLKCILNETLRLYPPIPINARFARRTTWLPRGGGPEGNSPVLIRQGLGVAFSAYYIHRRKDIYGENAREFSPERWEGTQLVEIGFAFLPFHGGARLCLGKDFALMEASCAIVCILREFPNIRLPPDSPVIPIGQEKQVLTVFLRPADGCKVILQ